MTGWLSSGQQAWPLARLQKQERIETDDYVIEWMPGMFPAPDIFGRDAGKDIGEVNAYRKHEEEDLLLPESFRVNLAHSFRTFVEDGTIEVDEAQNIQ